MAINHNFIDELQQSEELKKADINTPEGQDIIKSIYEHPAYIGLVERLREIMNRTTAKQQRYLDDGRMYPVVLALARQKVEETDFGQAVVVANPDRRIYALLKPTPAENLYRINVIFNCVREIVNPQEYEQFWLSLNGCHCAIRVAEIYDVGAISYEVARELLDEVFPPQRYP